MQKAGGYNSTRRWQQIFSKLPLYHLNYIGEQWDEAEFEKNLSQIISSFDQGNVASVSDALQGK
jgi:hypothetical protein